MPAPPRPTAAELAAAIHKTLRPLLARDLKVLFCGINPGLYSGATGHHFARPGNRFWPALHAGGFTPRVLKPWEEEALLALGYGITNFVDRTTATAAELSDAEIVEGARRLQQTCETYRPKVLAMLGVGAYRVGFGRKRAALGLQPETIGQTRLWVLPNPSGLNAHHTAHSLGGLFAELREAVETLTSSPVVASRDATTYAEGVHQPKARPIMAKGNQKPQKNVKKPKQDKAPKK